MENKGISMFQHSFCPLTFKLLQPSFIHARGMSSREVHTREETLPACSCDITKAQYIAKLKVQTLQTNDDLTIFCALPIQVF
jgi:hypothetical protein